MRAARDPRRDVEPSRCARSATRLGLAFVAGRGAARLADSLAIGRASRASGAGSRSHARRRLRWPRCGAGVALLLFFGSPCRTCPASCPAATPARPPTTPSELVPADALAYAARQPRPRDRAVRARLARSRRLPAVQRPARDRALALVAGPGGGPPDFERDVRPWFGGEAAIAMLGRRRGRRARSSCSRSTDAEGGDEFAASIAAGQVAERGLPRDRDRDRRRGLATAQVEGFLAIGTADGGARGDRHRDRGRRRRARWPTTRPRSSCATSSPTTASPRPTSRRGRGRRADRGDAGALGTLTPLRRAGREPRARRPSLTRDRGRRSSSRSAARSIPSAPRPRPASSPPSRRSSRACPSACRSDSLAYLGIGEPGTTVARAARPGQRAGAGDRGRLRGPRRAACDARARSTSSATCSTRSAARRRSRSSATARDRPAPAFPRARRRRGRRASAPAERSRRCRGRSPPPSTRQRPAGAVFGEQQIGGVEARSLRISPTVELTYAVFDGLAAIATDPAGIAPLAADEGGLDDARALPAGDRRLRDDEVSLLAYLDLGELVGARRAARARRGPGLRDLRRRSSAASRRSGSRSRAPTSCSAPTPDCWSPGPRTIQRLRNRSHRSD